VLRRSRFGGTSRSLWKPGRSSASPGRRLCIGGERTFFECSARQQRLWCGGTEVQLPRFNRTAVGSKSLSSIYADRVIFGTAANSFTCGVMVHDPGAQGEMLRPGKQRVLVADSSKIGTEATYRLCGIENSDLILTDKSISADEVARLRRIT
jgi:DeoR/GlpR family transcriptional regulator of sugar metabolism